MKKNILLFFTLILISISTAFGQIKKVNLNLIYGELNGGLPIPAEEPFAVTGAVPDNIEMVKLTIFPSKKISKGRL